MSQNTSCAVMQQRVEPHDSLDFFPTPPWATRALCEWLNGRWPIAKQTCWEPACGDGSMVRPLRDAFAMVWVSDVHDYGWGHEVRDFLLPERPNIAPDWIISNPPFRLGVEFVLTAIVEAKVGCALLVRLAFLEGAARYRRLFARHPPIVLQFAERVPMFKGRLDPKGSTATAYCWLVWPSGKPWSDWAHGEMRWIPPCRKRLERPGDYDAK